MTTVDSNRRMRENRMSGGVGGVTGAIPLPRPDRKMDCRVLLRHCVPRSFGGAPRKDGVR